MGSDFLRLVGEFDSFLQQGSSAEQEQHCAVAETDPYLEVPAEKEPRRAETGDTDQEAEEDDDNSDTEQGSDDNEWPHPQPWAVAPNTLGRSKNLTSSEVDRLWREQAFAKQCGVPWAERGPVGPDEGGPKFWRGQPFQANTRKWAKRGGRNKEYYARLAKQGCFDKNCWSASASSSTGKGFSSKGWKGKGTPKGKVSTKGVGSDAKGG